MGMATSRLNRLYHRRMVAPIRSSSNKRNAYEAQYVHLSHLMWISNPYYWGHLAQHYRLLHHLSSKVQARSNLLFLNQIFCILSWTQQPPTILSLCLVLSIILHQLKVSNLGLFRHSSRFQPPAFCDTHFSASYLVTEFAYQSWKVRMAWWNCIC